MQPVGQLLRQWRDRRRISQLALAVGAGISAKHISFVESGRAAPSRDMVLALAEALAVPLRGRNALLLAAGFAPVYPQHALDDPALAPARRAIDRVLTAHEPYPALAVDRHWSLVAANSAAQAFGIALGANVLRASLDPAGLGALISNIAEWRAHVLYSLQQQLDATGDPVIAALRTELGGTEARTDHPPELYATLRLVDGRAFLTTTTVFGTPGDITLAELAIESFFPI